MLPFSVADPPWQMVAPDATAWAGWTTKLALSVSSAKPGSRMQPGTRVRVTKTPASPG
jgi:hypothetical protein